MYPTDRIADTRAGGSQLSQTLSRENQKNHHDYRISRGRHYGHTIHTHTHTQWYTVRNKINPGMDQCVPKQKIRVADSSLSLFQSESERVPVLLFDVLVEERRHSRQPVQLLLLRPRGRGLQARRLARLPVH